jgi:hypothetical protein
MSDQPATGAVSETAQAWDSVRRVREPVAWLLLAVTAIAVLVSAWQLFGLSDGTGPAPVPSPAGGPPGPAAVATFGVRASAVAAQFASGGIVTLTVVAVILVTFAGGLTGRARQVTQSAVAILAVTLALGVVSWLGAAGAQLRPGPWFIFVGTDLAAVLAALIFTVAVLRSPALRPLTPQVQDFGEDEADFDEDDEGLEDT